MFRSNCLGIFNVTKLSLFLLIGELAISSFDVAPSLHDLIPQTQNNYTTITRGARRADNLAAICEPNV
jgi:hypothetical protein